MRKTVILLMATAVFLMAAGTLFASGAQESGAEAGKQQEVVLQWWTIDSEEFSAEAQQELAKIYSEATPGVRVEVTVLPSAGFGQKMDTALNAGVGAPDVAIYWNNRWFPYALVLDDFIKKDGFDKDQYIDSFWKTRALWDGKVIGLPTSLGATIIIYNKDLFDAKGAPYPSADWTAYDFIETAKKLVNPETMSWGSDRPRKPFRTVWHNYGALPYSDDSTTVDGYFNSPEMVDAYTWFWDLVHSGATPSASELSNLGNEGTGPVDLFLAGRIAMANLNQGHLRTIIEHGMNVGVLPEPQVEGKQRYVNAWASMLSVWKESDHPYEAWNFLKYLCGPEGQSFLMQRSKLVPTIASLLPDLPDGDTEHMKAFFDVLKYPQIAEWNQSHPSYSQIEKAAQDLWDMIDLKLIERDEIPVILNEMVPEMQKVLEENVAKLGS
jgi:multiple sugar transport system substrate-binding protein